MNHDVHSASWLQEFFEFHSETSFSRLVGEHLNLVYSVALRRCGGRSSLAQDVSQMVFIDLARKARTLPAGVNVSGWLYRHTCFVAATLMRAETRRRFREETAAERQKSSGDLDWSIVAPLLDDVLLELGTPDRDSIVLRYFEQYSLAEVGARLGVNENTARMRVERALEKLRTRLTKRGVCSTTAALAAALTGQAITAAPSSLASIIAAAALATTCGKVSSLGLLSLMTTKIELAIAIGIILGLGIPLALQHRAAVGLHEENLRLRRLLTLTETDTQAAHDAARQTADERTRLSEGHSELLRLRGELARLRRDLVATNVPGPPDNLPASRPDSATSWSIQRTIDLHQTLATAPWPWKDQNAILLVSPVLDYSSGKPHLQMESTIICAPLELLQRHGLAGDDSDMPQALSEDATTNLLTALKADGARLSKTAPTAPGPEGLVSIGFVEDDYDETMSFKLISNPVGDQQIRVAIAAERRTLSPLEQQILVEPDSGVRQELRKLLESQRSDEGGSIPGSH